MASKKKAATAALLGEPVSVGGGAAAPKKKKVKKEDGVGGGGGGPSLEKRLVSLLNSNPKGLGQDEVCEGLGCSPSDLLNPINDLLNKHRVELLQDGSGKIFYKIVSADKVEKLRGLSPADVLIYQLVEKSGNQGIWIKDLRRKSNLSALEIPKILKELQKRKLIKCEKSIAATNKKVYMLYEIEPAREVSGGAWYDKTTGEFDTEYMAALEGMIMHYAEKKWRAKESERDRIARGSLSPSLAGETGLAAPDELESYLKETGAFKTVPSAEEIGKICQGLVYEGRLERLEDDGAQWLKEERGGGAGSASSAAAAASSSHDDESRPLAMRKRKREEVSYVYRFVRAGAFQSSFQAIPCATCPVAKNCHEGNPISPQSCEYLTQWLQF